MGNRLIAVACAGLVPAVALLGLPGSAHAGPQSDDCAAALVLSGDISGAVSRSKAEDVCDGAAEDTDEPGLDDCVTALVQTQDITAGRAEGICDGSDPAG